MVSVSEETDFHPSEKTVYLFQAGNTPLLSASTGQKIQTSKNFLLFRNPHFGDDFESYSYDWFAVPFLGASGSMVCYFLFCKAWRQEGSVWSSVKSLLDAFGRDIEKWRKNPFFFGEGKTKGIYKRQWLSYYFCYRVELKGLRLCLLSTRNGSGQTSLREKTP